MKLTEKVHIKKGKILLPEVTVHERPLYLNQSTTLGKYVHVYEWLIDMLIKMLDNRT